MVVAVLDAMNLAYSSASACPLAVAHPSLGEARDLDAIGERALAAASNPPYSCVVDFRCPDRITDCIVEAPESRPRLTMCDLLTRPHGLAFGVTDGARTRDLRSHNPMPPVAVRPGVSVYSA